MPRTSVAISACLTALIASPYLTAEGRGAGRPTASASNVLLAQNRTEPMVAVDGRSPGDVVVAANTNYGDPQNGTYPDGYFTSTNGGRSFSAGNAPVIWPYIEEADPSLVFDGNGTLFFSYLAETAAYCSTGSSAVIVTHSIDHGRSFRQAHVVDTNSADDKPNLAVETVAHEPSRLFVTWTRFHAATSDIWFARSLDGGTSFRKAHMLHTESGDDYGSVPVAAPGHRLYVFWMAYPPRSLTGVATASLLFRESRDDGAQFGPVRTLARFKAIPQMIAPGSLRTLTQPAVAADPRGRIYVAWTQVARTYGAGRVASDIVISRSSNYGRTWTVPRRVNDTTANDRFMPAMALLPSGKLDIVFYDRRSDLGDLDVYAAQVSFQHGFRRSPNLRVNLHSSPVAHIFYIAPGSTCLAPGRFFGDYIGASAIGSDLGVVWADPQLQISSETDIWFSKVRLPAAE